MASREGIVGGALAAAGGVATWWWLRHRNPHAA